MFASTHDVDALVREHHELRVGARDPAVVPDVPPPAKCPDTEPERVLHLRAHRDLTGRELPDECLARRARPVHNARLNATRSGALANAPPAGLERCSMEPQFGAASPPPSCGFA